VPANNLPFLSSDPIARVAVQRTTLAIDAAGRFLCHTLDEALSPEVASGPGFELTADFDAIVVGSGMYGAFCAARLVRNGAKVLVLEAGPFLTGQHVQNPPNIGLPFGDNVVGSVGNPGADETNALVWGLPWRGNQEFGRLAFCVGGKSLFWGGWAPRLTDDVLDESLPGGATWPPEVAEYLRTYYPRIELQMGVSELRVTAPGQAPTPVVRTELFNSPQNLLNGVLASKLQALVGKLDVGPGGSVQTEVDAIEPAPIAVQADAPASGVFAFNKFSALPLLLAASREDFGLSASDQLRRLFIVPNVRVLGLDYNPGAGRAIGLRVFAGGAQRTLGIGPHTRIVLALSAIESTRLAQASFGATPRAAALQGRNLMAHLRNNFSVRIKRSALNIPPTSSLQTAAFNIRCKASNKLRYHFQFYAGFQPGNSAESLLYSNIVHMDTLQGVLANQDSDWVAMTFRGCAEMIGDIDTPTGNDGSSYVNLSNEIDGFGDRRAWVNLVQQNEDFQAFDEMDEAGFALALGLAGGNAADIEYFDVQAGRFVPSNPYARGGGRFGLLRAQGGIRDGLGTTYHDSGTLWMGDDPATSVTDGNGRFHDVPNVYCADQALFPRVGSANPVPTGLVLARRVAEAIVNSELEVVEVLQGSSVVAHHYAVEAGFEPLFVFDRDPVPRPGTTGRVIPNLPRGWTHIGAGEFVSQGLTVETRGGIGLLVYEDEPDLENFVLRFQWRAPTIRNNSGVYVRLPANLLTEPNKAIKTGYEIQIDNTGERPGDQPGFPFPTELFNPYHITGAVYPVHPTEGFPAQLPSPNGAPAKTNVATRNLTLWNDMEISAIGNRISVLLNGQATLQNGDYIDQAVRYPKGLIAFQNHFKGLRVQFRHVRLKRL
jgi:hypothetical protein